MAHRDENLAAFIAEHAHPYDAATDTYRRAPFAQPVKAGKNTAIYNAHSYHTKVPPQGIVPYIEHYTEPGDLILDSFCGSGMTGVAALMTGRHAILNDLSPAAVHIARNYCTPVDVAALRAEFERIKAAVKEEFDWLYGTTCDRCGGPATIQYTVWSDVLECGRCGNELVLWDVAVDHDKRNILNEFSCPTCGANWRKTQLRWLRSVPVLTNYECSACKPKRQKHATTSAEQRRTLEIENQEIAYWYPTTPFNERDWEMWRGVHREQNLSDVSQFFTKRNLRALSRLWFEIGLVGGDRERDMLRFAFTGISTRLVSKLTGYQFRKRGNVPVGGTLYIASFIAERNVWDPFSDRMNDIISQWTTLPEFPIATMIGSAAHLESMPGASIDYIFTDPPFGSNIFYVDCNLIWEVWLN